MACLATWILGGAVGAQEPSPPDPAEAAFFEQHVRPLLAQRCQSCHGADEQKGNLRLDSAQGVGQGGDTGPALLPGDPDQSLLIDAVRYGPTYQMPPDGRLPAAEVAVLVEWVRRGAYFPADSTLTAAPAATEGVADALPLWSFVPPRAVDPPAVADATWPHSAVDQFLLARLEAVGLSPAPAATPRTWLRRATYDLVGLPPTPEEVADFLADSTTESRRKVVDRLLASAAYGERWGRRWLDVARYADSNGMDENLAYAQAWRYRDWVVSAFNRDLPFDQFVREQVAGDLLAQGQDLAADQARLVATGFLCLGAKMLAEDDPLKMEMDIVDEQLDTLGQALLGLTIGCARCHDHKFDPFSTRDYYALAGILKSTRTMENFKVVARWQERPLVDAATEQLLAEHAAGVRALEAELKTVRTAAHERLLSDLRARPAVYLAAARRWLAWEAALPPTSPVPLAVTTAEALLVEAEDFVRGNVLRETTNYGVGIGVLVNAGTLPNFVEYDIELPATGAWQLEVRHAAVESRPLRLLANGVLQSERVADGVTGSWFPDTQTWSSQGVYLWGQGRLTLRLETDGACPHVDKLALVPRPWPEAAPSLESLAADGLDEPLSPGLVARFARWLKSRTDAGASQSDDELVAVALADERGPTAPDQGLDALLPSADRDQVAARAAALETQRGAAPPAVPLAMAVGEGEVADVRVHIRGSHWTQGELVPRGFPAALNGFSPPTLSLASSGRRELADWLSSPANPLTARVLVNRVWQAHFGQGLVRSPDNFGRLGEPPDNPELLDWLAVRFMEGGWSIKSLHRELLLSRAYAQSAVHNEQAAQVDPENRLVWRMNRRRLEAEPLRDALLAVSGQLELGLGGSLLKTGNREYVAGTASVNPTNYDSRRRSLYLPVVRSALYDVFQAFDFADPSVANGRRASTTVAPQALFMLNSPLMSAASLALAERALALAVADDHERVTWLYERAYARPPTADEAARAEEFVRVYRLALAVEPLAVEPFAVEPLAVKPVAEGQTAENQTVESQSAVGDAQRLAWQGLCRAILSANEFVYLD